ncbi:MULTISPECIES: hypothetical protein [Bacillaceae]|nr:hypothetical protein [Bacillus sp. FJAT-27916]
MKKLAGIFIVVLTLVTATAGGTLLAFDPGPIAPGGSSAIDR